MRYWALVLAGMVAITPVLFVGSEVRFEASPEPDVVRCALHPTEALPTSPPLAEVSVEPGGEYSLPVPMWTNAYVRCVDAAGNWSQPGMRLGIVTRILRVRP